MSRKILALAAGALFTLSAGAAMAAQPVSLSSDQLDQVTAGTSIALAGASATAYGWCFNGTLTLTSTSTSPYSAASGSLSASVSK